MSALSQDMVRMPGRSRPEPPEAGWLPPGHCSPSTELTALGPQPMRLPLPQLLQGLLVL